MSVKNNDHVPWIEKYRPQKLTELTQDNSLVSMFKKCLETKEITHLLLHGPPGTGKTSAIQALGRELFGEFYKDRIIEFNASDDRGINAVREKITNHAKKFVSEERTSTGDMVPPYKIIILDEADSMTEEAQDALRVIIEESSKVTRFCFICNYITKITDAIKSRCTAIYFKRLEYKCMYDKLKEISVMENMKLSTEILNTIIDVVNGDMRKAIMLLQNLKYLYKNKEIYGKKFSDFTQAEMKYLNYMVFDKYFSKEVTINDIYKLAGLLPLSTINKIIDKAHSSENYHFLCRLTKNIIGLGYPVDNILNQLNNCILERTDINDVHKSKIFIAAGNILYRIKDGSNESIQLLHMLSVINGVMNNNPIY